MRVADGEDRPLDLDGQVQLGPFGDVAGIHVAADVARRDDAVQARGGRRDADRPCEGPKGHAPARPVHCGGEPWIVVPMMQSGFRKLIAEQAEPRNVSRPAPARRTERQHAHLQRIARLRAVDVYRPRHRVDPGEIELFQVGRRGRSRELPRRGVEGLEV